MKQLKTMAVVLLMMFVGVTTAVASNDRPAIKIPPLRIYTFTFTVIGPPSNCHNCQYGTPYCYTVQINSAAGVTNVLSIYHISGPCSDDGGNTYIGMYRYNEYDPQDGSRSSQLAVNTAVCDFIQTLPTEEQSSCP